MPEGGVSGVRSCSRRYVAAPTLSSPPTDPERRFFDAMVAHERRLRTGRTSDLCSEECPHADARALWVAALEVFRAPANELTFLRSRGAHASRPEANETAGHAIRHVEDEAADVSDAPPAMRRGAFATRLDRSHVTTAEL